MIADLLSSPAARLLREGTRLGALSKEHSPFRKSGIRPVLPASDGGPVLQRLPSSQ
jgi:hypothetical protein